MGQKDSQSRHPKSAKNITILSLLTNHTSQVNDSVQVDIATGKIQDNIKFDTGNLCMVTGGRNTGRVGTIMSRERHLGSFDIVHVKDAAGHTFATRLAYIFVIGKGMKPY